MKHITTFICLILLSIAGTQNAQAQTKEETIDWLNTNGEDFLYSSCHYPAGNWNNSSFKITDETIIFTDFNPNVEQIKDVVSFSSILYQDVNTITIKEDFQCRPRHYFVIKTVGYMCYRESFKSSNTKVENRTDLQIFFIKDNEENAKRVLKAIMHLAKLSGAKENKQHF